MRVSIGDTRLFFDVEGASLVPDGPVMRERPTVVFLHGGPGADHSVFKPTVSPLADCAQLVYLDHRGQGRSDPSSPKHWNLKTWAADVKGFCDALEIERPIVVGGSFGGFVALQYAIDYPDHPSKLALLVTAARMDLKRIGEGLARFGTKEQRATIERFYLDPTEENEKAYFEACAPLASVKPGDPDKATRTTWRPEVFRHFAAGENRTFDLRASAARVRCPVLLLSGAKDPETTAEAGAELAQSLPANLVEFVVIENASHELATDAPEQIVQLLRHFITN
jgi:pimeloyl-ACP methyl ester carboxylesterase